MGSIASLDVSDNAKSMEGQQFLMEERLLVRSADGKNRSHKHWIPSGTRTRYHWVVKVYVSVFGDERGKEVAIAGLKAKTKYVRSELGKRMKLRLTPEIRFIPDDSIERGSRAQAPIVNYSSRSRENFRLRLVVDQIRFDANKKRNGAGHNRYIVVPFGGKTTRFRGPRVVITVYPAVPFGGRPPVRGHVPRPYWQEIV
ncbi:putative ribosome-binding factor A, chloroplastic [Dendrobium catenatum]|uniref:Putative ribosome-binding factor A, chloroplastic n=1 Tax=Dendrobium catenatum TaxID=906689 RepID=A0A2I0WWE6_9ASPA|nr:putative ribosome-binding factor A, chloroplastic [Dendrobium catenatum]